MDFFAVLIILFIVVPILAVLAIPIGPIVIAIGVLIILGGLLGLCSESEHKGAIVGTCLIIGVILFLIGVGMDEQRVYDALSYCPPFLK